MLTITQKEADVISKLMDRAKAAKLGQLRIQLTDDPNQLVEITAMTIRDYSLCNRLPPQANASRIVEAK